MKTPLADRILGWVNFANSQGYDLQRILVHPDDIPEANHLFFSEEAKDSIEFRKALKVVGGSHLQPETFRS